MVDAAVILHSGKVRVSQRLIYLKFGYLLWVALQHLQGLLERLDDLVERAASLCDVLGLTKGVKDRLVLVDSLIELSLELLLGHAHHEVPDQLGNGLSHSADRDLEDSVDTGADLLNEDVGSAGAWLLLLLMLGLLRDRLSVLIVLLRHLLVLRHNRGAVLFVVSVVDEHVVLFGIDDRLDELTGMVAFALKDLADNVHDLWAQGWASHEDSLDDGGGESLKLGVAILNQLKGWVAELVELWGDQVLEDIYGGEAWDAITFVHGDRSLNGHVRVFLGRIESLKVSVKTVELHLDLGTGRELLLLRALVHDGLDALLGIEFTRDLILVALNKLGDHGPNHVELLSL